MTNTVPKHWTWQDYLQELELKYNNWRNNFATTEMGLQDVNEIIQDLYPGPYTVEEAYIPSRQVIGFVLKFTDPKDETFWLLKNS